MGQPLFFTTPMQEAPNGAKINLNLLLEAGGS
jgi:hypothetical protein